MTTPEQLCQELKNKQELPSDASYAFKWLLGYQENSPVLGYRELEIIMNWIETYLTNPKAYSEAIEKTV